MVHEIATNQPSSHRTTHALASDIAGQKEGTLKFQYTLDPFAVCRGTRSAVWRPLRCGDHQAQPQHRRRYYHLPPPRSSLMWLLQMPYWACRHWQQVVAIEGPAEGATLHRRREEVVQEVVQELTRLTQGHFKFQADRREEAAREAGC